MRFGKEITLEKLSHFAKYHLKRQVYDHPAPEKELGVELIGLNLDDFYAEVRRRCPDAEELASVSYKGTTYPILRLNTGDPDGTRTLFIISGIHGNEQAGILSIPRLLADCDEQPEAYRGVRIVVVTPTNPVGADVGSRYNGDGFDLNRDFDRFETIEARAVRKVVLDTQPDFSISLHEGPQSGAFIFANRAVPRNLALDVLDELRREGVELAERDYFGRKLSPHGYAPVDRTLWTLSKLWASTLHMMPFGVYADLRGLPEITLETNWQSTDGEARIKAHLTLMRAVARAL